MSALSRPAGGRNTSLRGARLGDEAAGRGAHPAPQRGSPRCAAGAAYAIQRHPKPPAGQINDPLRLLYAE